MSNKINNFRLAELYSDFEEEVSGDSYNITRKVARKRKLMKKETSKARRRFNEDDE